MRKSTSVVIKQTKKLSRLIEVINDKINILNNIIN